MTAVGKGARRPTIGLILPATLQDELPVGPGATSGSTRSGARELFDLCQQAEATGADSLWAVDHLFWPHPINECVTTLTIAAAATSRPTLGSCILQLPLRHPAVVAKQFTSLQNLSGGRFILGVGVGSHPGEYARAGVDFHQRGRLMDEGIAALFDAWSAGHDRETRYRQEPLSTRVPLWIGGASRAALRRAATVGDGWAPLFITPDDYGTSLTTLRRQSEEAGRDPDSVEPAVVVFARVGPDDEAPARGRQWLSELYGLPAKAFERHLVAGQPETCAVALRRYVDAGARHIVVMVAGSRAVRQFGLLRSAFVTCTETVPAGVAG